jgi:hypothetical protein
VVTIGVCVCPSPQSVQSSVQCWIYHIIVVVGCTSSRYHARACCGCCCELAVAATTQTGTPVFHTNSAVGEVWLHRVRACQ